MKWRGVNELREEFLSFFERKQHTRMASAPLIPQGDNSLLLINSGMAPLKKFFLGQAVPPNQRVTTCQKCIRTPDIERVGKTARHGTYFEMLGNFSFGDYFKNEATAWAWEFFTEVLEMPADKLYISVYEEDDEAYDIWTQKIGIDPSHMVRMGKEDNFWEHGSGPCGPCSEIYFDRGDEKGCGSPDCHVGCECDRFVEVWNLVFSQFDSDGNGHYERMAKPNIDTGMGLERLACVMQGVDNLFEVDTVQNIMKHISSIAGVEYKKDDKTDVSLRVITDHIRSTTFMVGDGVMPSNEGRGYVLRRLLRRAARHGRLIGINEPFLFNVCETVIKENESAYPELREKAEYIKKIIQVEEENFSKTVDKGLELLNGFISQSKSGVLSGEDAFKLSDTYGFPIDLTLEIAEEKGVSVDLKKYEELVALQRQKARDDHAAKASSSWADNSIKVDAPKTVFTGYTEFSNDSVVLAIYDGTEEKSSANEGDSVVVILDKTPFYAESGGQASDTGTITSAGAVFAVDSVAKTEDGHYLHIGTVERGTLNKNDKAVSKIDVAKRQNTMKNHTSAHILQAALREVLGDHVHQAGQLVNSDRCRFDFSHFSAMTTDEIMAVENRVNEIILSAYEVTTQEMPIEEARKLGAMALFGEKYGDIVRVVKAGDFSVEFCGGTHVDNTSKIGLFKIISENSVAAGVRRIEAVTGSGVLQLLNENISLINEAAAAVKAPNASELVAKCTAMANECKSLEKELAKAYEENAMMKISSFVENAFDMSGVSVVCARVDGVKNDILRTMGDKIRDKGENMIAVLAGVNEGSGVFCVSCSKGAIDKGAHAGKIAKEISSLTGGKGGGRPDSAMAGIGDISAVDGAMDKVKEVLSAFIK
ncbi:MAG: alanine--tRNA ligase [Oscillospiraceae bacterium]|nr:alanine--tRNA ligase [Oscillospiraceae bacterium]